MIEPLDFIRSIWPAGVTKPELEDVIGHPVNFNELRRSRAIENTGVCRTHPTTRDRTWLVWRFKPYQLPLPLEEPSCAAPSSM